jgi:hypothetical protein
MAVTLAQAINVAARAERSEHGRRACATTVEVTSWL